MTQTYLEMTANELAMEAVIFDIDIADDPMLLMAHLRRKRPNFHTFCMELPIQDWDTVREMAESKYNRTCRLAAQL